MNFSSPAQDVIQRPLVLDQSKAHGQLTAEEFRDYYELEWTANEIISNDYKRVREALSLAFKIAISRLCPQVALQFPDELLCDSVPIYHSLKRAVDANTELYVLADTSYGRYGLVTHLQRLLTGDSCCVDEVAAQHVDADAVVHYGHACMSK